MDSLIALKGKDFVIIAADTTNAYSVLRMKVPPTPSRTTMIKYGTSMEKNYSPLEENILMYSSSEIIFKKILPISSIKMDTNSPLTTPPSSSDQNWQKPSEEDPTASTACLQDSKAKNLDSIGWTISVQ